MYCNKSTMKINDILMPRNIYLLYFKLLHHSWLVSWLALLITENAYRL